MTNIVGLFRNVQSPFLVAKEEHILQIFDAEY